MGAAKHIKETFQKEAAGKKENGVNYKAALRKRIQVYDQGPRRSQADLVIFFK